MMLTRRVKFLIINFLGLQLTWAACAYGATHEWPLLGVYVGVAYIGLHFILVEERLRDFNILLIVGILGIIIDSLNTQFNVVSFSADDTMVFFIPYWLMMLWFVFSLTLPYSLYWLEKNMIVACIAGAMGGSLSYLLGHELGAITFSQPTPISFTVYFIEWGIVFPLSLKLVKYLSRHTLVINNSYSSLND